MREAIAGRYVGHSVRRVEDQRLLTGTGRYVDDIVVPGMAHAAFLRSPHPHATIASIDTSAAAALPVSSSWSPAPRWPRSPIRS